MFTPVLLAALSQFHAYDVPSLTRYEGRVLAGVTVAAFAQSEIIENMQVIELTLQGTHRWQSHCVKRFIRSHFRLLCEVEATGQPTLRVSLTDAQDVQWRGEARLPEPVHFEGETIDPSLRMEGIRMTGGRLVDAQKVPFASWSILPRTSVSPTGRGLHLSDPLSDARLERVAALALTLNLAGDRWATGAVPSVYDGYRLTDGTLPDRWHTEALDHATLVDDPSVLSRAPRLDRAAGVLVERKGPAGRIVMEFAGGSITELDTRAGPDTVDGFALMVGAGMRLGARSQLNVNMGMQAGFHREAVGRFGDGRFDLGLQIRQAFSLGATLEPVIGARLRGHLRFADGQGPDGEETADAAQLGWGVAPTVGLQWPWTLNDFDTRLVVFLEAAPEWTFWSDPDLDAPTTALERSMKSRMGTRDRQFNTMLGVRFEL